MRASFFALCLLLCSAYPQDRFPKFEIQLSSGLSQIFDGTVIYQPKIKSTDGRLFQGDVFSHQMALQFNTFPWKRIGIGIEYGNQWYAANRDERTALELYTQRQIGINALIKAWIQNRGSWSQSIDLGVGVQYTSTGYTDEYLDEILGKSLRFSPGRGLGWGYQGMLNYTTWIQDRISTQIGLRAHYSAPQFDSSILPALGIPSTVIHQEFDLGILFGIGYLW